MNEEKMKKNLTRGIISSSCFYSKVKKEVVASSSSYAVTIDRFMLFLLPFPYTNIFCGMMSNNADFMHQISNALKFHLTQIVTYVRYTIIT